MNIDIVVLRMACINGDIDGFHAQLQGFVANCDPNATVESHNRTKTQYKGAMMECHLKPPKFALYTKLYKETNVLVSAGCVERCSWSIPRVIDVPPDQKPSGAVCPPCKYDPTLSVKIGELKTTDLDNRRHDRECPQRQLILFKIWL